MTFKINGTEITVQPTAHHWVSRKALGIDGAGHPVYPATREYELRWDLVYQSQINQLQNFFATVVTTGTAVVDLPEYGASSYAFKSYTGCVLSEPSMGDYFTQHATNVTLLITNIIT